MPKFQVDLPEEPEEDRPQFSFRDADPVGVGEEKEDRKETPRQKSLGSVIALLLQSHEQLQSGDTQLFTLVDLIARLKTGEVSIEGNEGRVKQMVDIVRKQLIATIVTLDQTLFTVDLEERGILGTRDGREFARLGLQLIERIGTEFERWGLEGPADDIPPEAVELMRQAVVDLEAEETANES